MQKTCERCGCTFTTTHRRQRFHNKRCGAQLTSERAQRMAKKSVELRQARTTRHPEWRKGYKTGFVVGQKSGRRSLAREWLARLREYPKLRQVLGVGAKQEHAA